MKKKAGESTSDESFALETEEIGERSKDALLQLAETACSLGKALAEEQLANGTKESKVETGQSDADSSSEEREMDLSEEGVVGREVDWEGGEGLRGCLVPGSAPSPSWPKMCLPLLLFRLGRSSNSPAAIVVEMW